MKTEGVGKKMKKKGKRKRRKTIQKRLKSDLNRLKKVSLRVRFAPPVAFKVVGEKMVC